MPDYLTQRDGHWHYVRRVPLQFANLDPRGIVKHSTGVSVAKDRRGLKAGKIADVMNRDLEAFWFGLIEGKVQQAADTYSEARRRAKILGFDYVEIGQLTSGPTLEILQRLEALAENGLVGDKGARAALLAPRRSHRLGCRKSSPSSNTRPGTRSRTCRRTSSSAGATATSWPSRT